MASSSSSLSRPEPSFNRLWAECPADTMLKLRWERGFWKDFFDGPSVPKGVLDWKVAEPPLFISGVSTLDPAVSKRPRKAEPIAWQQVVQSGAEQTWQDKREADFQVSLRRWHDTLISLPCNISIVQQLKQFNSTADRLRMLRDVFWKKSPATLRKRVNSFCRFVDRFSWI